MAPRETARALPCQPRTCGSTWSVHGYCAKWATLGAPGAVVAERGLRVQPVLGEVIGSCRPGRRGKIWTPAGVEALWALEQVVVVGYQGALGPVRTAASLRDICEDGFADVARGDPVMARGVMCPAIDKILRARGYEQGESFTTPAMRPHFDKHARIGQT